MSWLAEQALDSVAAVELSQVTAPLAESDRKRLADFWAHVIAESGAELPRAETPADGSRRARRVERQRADRLVRVLSTACRIAEPGSGVAA